MISNDQIISIGHLVMNRFHDEASVELYLDPMQLHRLTEGVRTYVYCQEDVAALARRHDALYDAMNEARHELAQEQRKVEGLKQANQQLMDIVNKYRVEGVK